MPTKRFLGLKSKMYTFIREDVHEPKKTKGTDKNIEDYKNILFKGASMRHEINRIQTKAHNIGSNRINSFFYT